MDISSGREANQMKRIEQAIAAVVFGLAGFCILRLILAITFGGIR